MESLSVSGVGPLQHAPRRLPAVGAAGRRARDTCSCDYHVPYVSFLLHFFQNSLIKRIKGENVYVKHSNLMLEVGIGVDQCMSVCVGFF